ncbi:hypothetical protein GCK72_004424 [Caenorhabditis remanei]|uniref:C-type lectin domain-containing protein n=1 Tax=Caenorhabditis remanei TaxID=31234 RepID=A0A6A5HCC6_CAERE|nr:hypothetical protein GCK72_004424 [Caenorhabditis remanei]KAF1764476.1 hypothetical protein GCK72_004424 [Caenorhabditis remanei]
MMTIFFSPPLLETLLTMISELDYDCALNFNGSCYIPSEELINSTQSLGLDSAQKICQENDGNLISIHSANENRFVLNYYKSLGLDSVLLGAVVTKHFFWMDDSHWDFSNIDHTNDEYGTCLKMALQNNKTVSKGSWYITPCDGSHYFMCKRPAGNSDLIHVPKVVKAPPSQCNKVLLMSGTFSSPTYPENCMYTLKTLDGQQIRITFQKFYVANGYIQIVEDYQGAEVKQKFSGTNKNLRYKSLTNELKVLFITEDLENMNSEFVAKFFSVFETE